jgi:hypothetical protein
VLSDVRKGDLRLVDIAREGLAHELSFQVWKSWLMQEIMHDDLCVQKHAWSESA